MVVGGVAPRVAARLSGVIYLDAFLPEDGKHDAMITRPAEVAKLLVE